MLFMPTFTSGPIDRFKRFNEDYQAILRDELMNMLEQAVKYIMLGFLYKFVLAQIFWKYAFTFTENTGFSSRWYL